LSYDWSTGEDTASIEINEAGTYIVTVTDGENGCSDTLEIEVIQNITKPEIIVTGNEELTCTNDTIILDASQSSGQGELSFDWSTGEDTASIEVSEAGEYSVTVTDSENGCSDTLVIEVNQDIAEPIASITSNQELNCSNESIVLDASGSTGQGTLSYLWSTGEETATIEISEAGEYAVTITDSDNGCSNTTSVEVTQNIIAPTAHIGGGSVINCSDDSIVLDASGSTGQGTLSYLWSTGEETASIEVNSAGDYSVTVTDSSNGCSNTASIEVTGDSAVPEASIHTDTIELTCDEQSTNLDASGSVVDSEASYLWSTGATTAIITVSEPGVYSVTVTDSDNGCSDTAEIEIIENTPEIEAIITGNWKLSCTVTSTQLDASGSNVQGTASYLWSTGETAPIIEVTEAGNYTVTVTDSESGCANAEAFEVIFEDNPQEIVGGSIDICLEEETLDLTSLLPGGYVAGGTWSDDMNSGELFGDNLDLLAVNLETYEFTYTEPGDCGRMITVSVSVNDECVVLACESPDNITISKVVTVNDDGVNEM
jgi:membrane-bound inhibitor of C-type lysozyme